MAIFSHITVGVADLEKSRAFYDAALAPFGYKRLFDTADRSGYGATAPELMIVKPFDGKAPTAGNGVTVGLTASDPKVVDAFHKAALANGGKCDGPPGPRPAIPGLYAAYVRDPVGNKLTAICMKAG
jgi:catechol 2,3-dioxygenase-like lactoylglutathione lyase family enzyme